MSVKFRAMATSMDALTITWVLAAIAGNLVVVMAMWTFRVPRRGVRSAQPDGVTWKLTHLLDNTDQPILVAAALAVAVHREHTEAHPALFSAVGRSRLATLLRDRIDHADASTRIEALELVEVLRVHLLLGDAAVLTKAGDKAVVRAACDAAVELEPGIGIGILVGLVGSDDSWVLDSLGRAVEAAARRDATPVPLSRSQWRSAPVLAQRALAESATFSRATGS